MVLYDSEWVRRFYDHYGLKEWDRWDHSKVQTVKFEIHRHYIREYIKPSYRILEAGAGAGRFTKELSSITQKITVVDISPVQLRLNKEKAAEYGFASSVEQWIECDMCDLSDYFTDDAC